MGAWERAGALVRACLRLTCNLNQNPSLLWASAFLSGHRDGDEVASKTLLALTACGREEVSPEAAHSFGREDRSTSLNCMTRTMTTVHTLSSVLCSKAILFISSPNSLNHLEQELLRNSVSLVHRPCPQCPEQSLAGGDVQIMFME